MGENKTWYLVSYDIRDDRRLRRVAKTLKGYGSRAQFSVFRCRLSDRSLERMKWELSKLTEKEDSLLIIGLCSICVGKIMRHSPSQEWVEDHLGYDII